MKGKILMINPSGNWQHQMGHTMYTYMVKIQAMNDLEFEGQANSKSETVEGLPYKVGEEVEFEHEESNSSYPHKLKIKKEGSEQYRGGGNQKGNNRAFALSYAKDLAVAFISNERQVVGEVPTTTEDIINQADKFVKWLDS